MKHEKPLAGNPNQLTINQHVLPRASIARFADVTGMIEVCRDKTFFKADAENPIFCARRVWDQKAEEVYHQLESDFQDLAERIVTSPNIVLDQVANELTSNFFALVCARTLSRRNSIPDAQLTEAAPTSKFEKDMLEKLEKVGYVTLNQQGAIPARMIAGPRLQIQIDNCLKELGNPTWHIACSDSLEFLVSDSIDRVPVIPISPLVMLRMDSGGILAKPDIEHYNDIVREQHDSYYFCRDRTTC